MVKSPRSIRNIEATNVAVKDSCIVGVDDAESYERGPNTRVIDLKGRRVIPGLNDSHTHVIRGDLAITSNFGGMVFPHLPTDCAC
jgi:predicted amidohydrolase YtcJ